MTKKNTPALRFDGFDGEWRAVEIQHIADVIGGGTPSTSVTSFWDGDIDWYSPNEIGETAIAKPSNKRITRAGLANSSARLLPAYRTVLFTSRASIGHAAILDHPATTNQGFQSFVLENGVDTHFVYAVVPKITEIAEQLASGSTFLEVSNKTVREIEIHVPTTEEQRAIGELFADLDALIEQHRAKRANLQQTKTALLQRMFPQDGADEPELRLDGFIGAWQPRIMGDCAEYSKGSGYSKKDIADEGTPVIHYGRLYTNYETAITDIDTFASPQPSALISRGDEVLVPASGETAEDIAVASALLQSGVLIGGDLNVIRPRRNIDPVFLALSLSNGMAKETLVKRAQGKSVVHLRNSDIQDVEIFFPTLEEQRAIGEVFSNLDALIAAESRYITKLTQAKTALLQRMFV